MYDLVRYEFPCMCLRFVGSDSGVHMGDSDSGLVVAVAVAVAVVIMHIQYIHTHACMYCATSPCMVSDYLYIQYILYHTIPSYSIHAHEHNSFHILDWLL